MSVLANRYRLLDESQKDSLVDQAQKEYFDLFAKISKKYEKVGMIIPQHLNPNASKVTSAAHKNLWLSMVKDRKTVRQAQG
mgnify:CR=1 FL=1